MYRNHRINQQNKIYQQAMKETSNSYRVSFSYISTPVDKPSIESKKKMDNNPLASLELGGKKDNIPQVKITERGYQTHRYMHIDQHTLKKESWEVEATTKRKQIDNKIVKNMQTQGKVLNLEQLSPPKNLSSNEISALKDEISYLKKRLIQVENSQKSIKLQFQLYKSNQQSRRDSINTRRQDASSIKKNQDEEKIRLKEELLQSQRKKIELELKIQQQITHKSQILKSNQQLTQMMQNKQIQLEDLKNKMQQIQLTIQLTQTERGTFKEKQQQSERIFTLQLQRISQQNERLNNLFQSQKNAKLFLQHELKQKILQNNSLKVTVDQLTFQIQNRLKDIQFLNNQSYSLDMSLSSTLSELNFLKLQSSQSAESKQGEVRIKAAQEYIKSLEIRILQLQAQVQKAGITVYSLSDQYNGILRRLNEQVLIIEQFKQKNQWLQNQKLHIKREKINQEQYNIQSLSHIQEQLFSLKVQNQQLKNQKIRLEDSQRVLVNEIQWIINEKNGSIIKIENKHKQQVDSLLLKIQELKKKKEEQQSIFKSQLIKKQQQIKKQNESKINNSSFNSFISSVKQLQTENNSDSCLSPNDIQKHLLRLKKQASISEEQNIKLREMLQGQLQLSQRNQNDQIRLLKQKYERQLQLSKEQYTMQLNFYIEEVQKLMAEINKFKSKSKYRSSEVIQEDPEEDNSMDLSKEEKVKKDLIIYGQDPFDYYVSPLTNMTIKTPDQKGDNNYILKDIIDLDQKINCYISNLKTNKDKIDQ